MIEVIKCPPEARDGEGFVLTQMKRGTFVVASGTFTASDISGLPAAQKNKPGYAYSGKKKWVQAYAANLADRGPAYPIDKLTFVPEDADTDYDTIKAGEQVVVYMGGRFRTSEYTNVTSTIVFGNYLKLSASGTLTDEATLTTATNQTVARTIALHSSNADPADRRLEIELFNVGV